MSGRAIRRLAGYLQRLCELLLLWAEREMGSKKPFGCGMQPLGMPMTLEINAKRLLLSHLHSATSAGQWKAAHAQLCSADQESELMHSDAKRTPSGASDSIVV